MTDSILAVVMFRQVAAHLYARKILKQSSSAVVVKCLCVILRWAGGLKTKDNFSVRLLKCRCPSATITSISVSNYVNSCT